jgi:hypothetical protein
MKSGTLWHTACLLLLCTTSAFAQGIRVGFELPALTIEQVGELIIAGDDIEFIPWSTASLKDKTVYLQYMAARPSADRMNRHVNDALEAANFPEGSFESAALINLDDATFGASNLALRQIKKNKLKHPGAHIVADRHGKGLQTWQLETGQSAVGLVGKSGKVLFFKQGRLSEEELQQMLSLLQDQING